MASPFLLDTAVLLHWVRADAAAQEMERRFGLTLSELRPLVCEVSLGEMLAFSRSLKWGDKKVARLAKLQEHVVLVDISERRVLEEYANVSTLAKERGWALFNGKNDLWIAAAAKATGAHLLTTDHDFKDLRSEPGWKVTLLDGTTGAPLA